MDKIVTDSYRLSITDCSNFFNYDRPMPNSMKDNPPYAAFAKRFNALCVEAKLPNKQEELAAALSEFQKISGPFIAGVKKGKKMPSFARAIQWATILGVSVEYLLTGRGDKYPVVTDGEKAAIARLFDSLKEATFAKALMDDYRDRPPAHESGLKLNEESGQHEMPVPIQDGEKLKRGSKSSQGTK